METEYGHKLNPYRQLRKQYQSMSISTLFPYNYKTQLNIIYIQHKFRQRTKATLYGGVIKRPRRPERDYP